LVLGDGQRRRVLSVGGRFVHDDAGETPNTQLTVFDYAELPIFLENRVLAAKPGVRFTDHIHGVRQGVYVQCEGGFFAGRFGGAVYDRNGAKIRSFQGDGGENHLQNFVDAVRSRDTASLAAPLETGRVSTSSCLFGNISYRAGRKATADDVRSAIESVPTARPVFDGLARHLEVHGIRVNEPVLTLGAWVEPDADLTGVAGIRDAEPYQLELARHLVRGAARPPYVIPEQV
jgi:hypothetical protein